MHVQSRVLLVHRGDQWIKSDRRQSIAQLPAVRGVRRGKAGWHADRLNPREVGGVTVVGMGERCGAHREGTQERNEFHASKNSYDSVARTHTVTYGNASPPALARAGCVASSSRTSPSTLVRTWVGEVMQ